MDPFVVAIRETAEWRRKCRKKGRKEMPRRRRKKMPILIMPMVPILTVLTRSKTTSAGSKAKTNKAANPLP